MFEWSTRHAQRAIANAHEQARALSHDYIGTEHLLLGVLHERDSTACGALEGLDI